jgi:hypothetical protein
MDRPPRPSRERLLSAGVVGRFLFLGTIQAAGVCAVFFWHILTAASGTIGRPSRMRIATTVPSSSKRATNCSSYPTPRPNTTSTPPSNERGREHLLPARGRGRHTPLVPARAGTQKPLRSSRHAGGDGDAFGEFVGVGTLGWTAPPIPGHSLGGGPV